MKTLKSILLFVSVGILFTFSNCGETKPAEEPITDQQLTKLSKAWKIKTVTLDAVDKTSTYPGFVLTMTGTKGAVSFGYTTTARPTLSVWKASGTWTFGTQPVTMLVRDPDNAADKLDMTYSVTETSLQVSFNFQGNGYTRVDAVKGNWVFTFGL